jgi:hypothetical protein
MDKQETPEAMAAIGMMLQAFPSAQSSITADSPKVYLFAVEEYSLDALKRACRSIVRGEVKDLKPDFPPTAPKLAQIVKDSEAVLKVEAWQAVHTFVEKDTHLWLQMAQYRADASLMATTLTLPNGSMKTGWYFPKEQVAEAQQLTLPPPVSRKELDEINRRLADKFGFEPTPFAEEERRSRFTVGNPEDEAA